MTVFTLYLFDRVHLIPITLGDDKFDNKLYFYKNMRIKLNLVYSAEGRSARLWPT